MVHARLDPEHSNRSQGGQRMTDVNQPPAREGMLCPVCRVDLVMSDRQGVEIDYCPRCRGVWLDRGELDKILERSVGAMPPGAPTTGTPATPPGYADPRGYDIPRDYGEHRGGHHGGQYRRRSFLHDLFG